MTSTREVLDNIDDAIADWEVGPDAVRFNAPEEARPPVLPVADQIAGAHVAMERFADVAVLVVTEDRWAELIDQVNRILDWMHTTWSRQHRQGRCPTCHPVANPSPLPIDGAEYARRRRSR